MIARLTGFRGRDRLGYQQTERAAAPRPGCISRAEKFFGFRAQMPFEEGLRRTIEWYQQKHGMNSREEHSYSCYEPTTTITQPATPERSR